MSDHKWISDFFVVFFGQDSDEYGDTYPEIVDTAFKTISKHGMQHIDDLINSIDLFRETYTDNESAASALNMLTHELAGDTHYCKYPCKTAHSLLEIFRHTDYVT
ncbi:hypothetical protein [Erwinia rhapontici]|uniref:hypothetical protein n=1 Tax=Erwinia rhapontici TaxID=55212 RepID=UPI003B9F612C